MELLWTASLLGLVGSLHCAAMCGPLVLAVTAAGGARRSLAASRLVYHVGRLGIYCVMGLVFGAAGKSLALAGLQRWLSLLAGAALLGGLLLSSRVALKTPVARLVVKLKSAFSRLLRQRTLASQFALGAINGLLPCGLVYIAAAAAAATGALLEGTLYMAMFGLGTLPMMLGLGLVSPRLRALAIPRMQKLIPISVALVAVLLLLRGMSLGIPYLSPDLAVAGHASCH